VTVPPERGVGGRSGPGADELARLLAAAEPAGPRTLGELVARLEAGRHLNRISCGGGEARLETPLAGIVCDSRQVGPGSVFVAISGGRADGHEFVAAAGAAGAAAAIVERELRDAPLPLLVVRDSRLALAAAAAWWYRDPSLELGIVGITGTDGKTTTAYLVTAVLEAAGISTGLITTAGLKVGATRLANPEHVTTPQAPELQRLLRAMATAGNSAAIVETTSHGLALDRVAEIAYDVAAFTNLTHEHLELHGTFEAYREAKLGLFRGLGAARPVKALARQWPRAAVVNVDDAAAPYFVAAARDSGARLLTYGLDAAADVRATAVDEDARRLRVDITTPRWHGAVNLRLAGRFNVHNALAAAAIGEALELSRGAVAAGLEGVAGVPGRMERIDLGQPFGVVVDYAHSPASLEKVLDILRPVAAARGGGLIAVFGSAGERDVAKRPMMGRVAGERCRLVVVTDEDPRGEDGLAIIDQIAAGAESAGRRRGEDVICVADRREAIATAFARANSGDVVLLAGKGHEQSIIMSDGPHPWDERGEALAALSRMGFGSAGPVNRNP
jgi:UDP-N-acetylmuramoyl-L-alanyl-D-glutamate--2,6-diaminopimelate ligase